MNKNRIEGAAEQGERANDREALVVKARWRRSGGCAVKECVLTWGDLALCLKGRRKKNRSGKSAEAVIAIALDKLRLKINESKSAVTSAFGRKFLGFELYKTGKNEVKRAVSRKALETFKQRIRQLTRRSGGRSIEQVVESLRPYVLGWKAYFGMVQTPRVWRTLDEWMRHRMRTIQLKHWKRGTTIYRELLALGAPVAVAHRIAANSRRWQRNSRYLLNSIFTIAYFDRLGMPRLT